jgi:hypothetical protein
VNYLLIQCSACSLRGRLLWDLVAGVELGDFGREIAPVTDGIHAEVPP